MAGEAGDGQRPGSCTTAVRGGHNLLGQESGSRRRYSHHLPPFPPPCQSLREEVETLKRDKNVLMQEVIRLRQGQVDAAEEIAELREAVERQQQRQQQMIAFLAQAMQHPALVQHFVTSAPSIKRLEDGRRRKKRKGGGDSDSDGHESPAPEAAAAMQQQLMPYQPPQSLGDLATAFMQLLSTQSEPEAGAGRRGRRGGSGTSAVAGGPIIQEPAGSGATPTGAPAPAAPMMLGSMPVTAGARVSTDAAAPAFVPLPGTNLANSGMAGMPLAAAAPSPPGGGPTITELPLPDSLGALDLDGVDLENLSDILPMGSGGLDSLLLSPPHAAVSVGAESVAMQPEFAAPWDSTVPAGPTAGDAACGVQPAVPLVMEPSDALPPM